MELHYFVSTKILGDSNNKYSKTSCGQLEKDTVIYFTEPFSSWQKGAIKNANKLIRQYLSKGKDFNKLSEGQISKVQYKTNRRLRKKLGFKTPIEMFFKKL